MTSSAWSHGNVGQLDVDRPLDVGIDDHVQAADVSERPQDGAQIDAFEVEADRVAGELPRLVAARPLRRLCGLRRRLGRGG